ncbi:poly(ethylene terephthalate) hydrolase family protein [Paenibacillus polymyxa]|uniref:poly(ethylene terephthalate) hydrolase family protein n=1 Tax=Paenibacillus polymyxa TaxID=1406 RepID=UPI0025B69802|nr:alpha/beta hydrolase [Paenibacillus polymyxa]MDN4085404.1 alpha/beta hydrolase [Paenibacillus polymyxa]MDN4090805.1 alpha/beta hydrolase [Paenibacillus polymyxa]MDN4111384.1 alpha/beta hydrolase [Paenibacillus polymyxa]
MKENEKLNEVEFMKIIKRILLILVAIVIVVIVGVLAILWYRNAYYYKLVETDKPIETQYTAMGPYKVSYQEFDSENATFKKNEIWYPSDLKDSASALPLVIMANGTGTTASKYTAVFKHLASWGFIVVGNEDENSRTGASSSASLNFMLSLNKDSSSDFYGKIDVNNIGIGGHSQGGVGAINAVTKQDNGSFYKAMYTASATSSFWGQQSELGTDWSYDISKVDIPYFMVAGTGYFDAGTAEDITATEGQGITPLWSLQKNYADIPDTVTKVMARRVNTDHSDMLTHADGYMTAWFMYWLKGDVQAGNAFFGDDAELLENANWQDVIRSQ